MENRTENRIKFFAKSARGEQRERRAVLTEGVGKGVAGKKFWKNRKKRKKHLHSVSDCAIINKSPGDSDRQKKIRVWRSLVSRLNGVQEALSSNLNTRTIKDLKSLRFQVFLQPFCRWGSSLEQRELSFDQKQIWRPLCSSSTAQSPTAARNWTGTGKVACASWQNKL